MEMEKELSWFKEHSHKTMDAIAARLSGVVAPWLSAPPAQPQLQQLHEDVTSSLSPAPSAPAKAPHLSVDEILAQARAGAPKKSVGGDGSSSGPGTPARSAKKERKAAAAASAAEEEDRTISFRSADQLMHGFVVLQGHACVEAEVNIQFKTAHRGVSGSAELEIRSSRPWRLVQLQNTALLVSRAVEYLQRKQLGEALDELRFAQDELVLPCSRIFPADPRVFHPRLPADLLVELCVLDKAVLSIQALLVRPVAQVKAAPPIPLFLTRLKAGDVFAAGSGNKWLEVLEVCSVQCPLATVASVAADIDKAFAELSELHRNAKILFSCT